MNRKVLKAKKELISLLEQTNKDLELGKNRMRPLSMETAKTLLDIIESKIQIKEPPNWICPYCQQTNMAGWPYCISCETTPKPKDKK
jgi:hypothetical protein